MKIETDNNFILITDYNDDTKLSFEINKNENDNNINFIMSEDFVYCENKSIEKLSISFTIPKQIANILLYELKSILNN